MSNLLKIKASIHEGLLMCVSTSKRMREREKKRERERKKGALTELQLMNNPPSSPCLNVREDWVVIQTSHYKKIF